ncbi:UNVERIFIED_ORG: hypothetical protein QFZ59_001481 [Bacillus sp. B2I3]|nr:hypothetical protein [Bacillus sp. B2I3]
MEEICNTSAEKLASRGPAGACVEEAWQTVGGKGCGFLKSKGMFSRKNCRLVYFQPSFRLVYPLSFSPVLLNGWKKYATLLPNNWLAETPQTLALMRLGSQSAERERVSEINWNFLKKKLQVRLIPNQV